MEKRLVPTTLLAFFAAVFLASCGGGLGLSPDPAIKTVPDVTAVRVERFVVSEEQKSDKGKPLYYSGKVTLTLTGKNLDQELTVRFPKCLGLEEVAGSATALERVYTCTLRGVGFLTIEVLTTAELNRLWISKIFIPLPAISINTNMGSLVFELDAERAPQTVDNFLRYAHEGFYANTIFHRVVPSVLAEGGGFDTNLRAKATHEPIKLERSGLSNLRGTIAMARTAEPDSATSQFFINVADNTALDTRNSGYTVFGKLIILGRQTQKDIDAQFARLDAIAAMPTQTVGAHPDVPITPVIIEDVEQKE